MKCNDFLWGEQVSSILQGLLSLAAAGTMMLSAPLDKAAPQNDIDGTLFLANREWRMSRYYVPEGMRQAEVTGQVRTMRQEAASALEEMYAACLEESGITLTSVSGYRSYSKQSTIYQNKLERVGGSKAKADAYVARPGASEHQLGMAMDVGQKGSSNLTAAFANTGGGKWIRENCWRFGFILRYDEGWEEVTGYSYEPWHIRYVGKEVAAAIHEDEMPLETYLLLLRQETLLTMVAGDTEEQE